MNRGKDLEVGAVDELLFGEYVVRPRYREEKNFTLAFPSHWLFPQLLGSPLIL
jgi:hypothetical protein